MSHLPVSVHVEAFLRRSAGLLQLFRTEVRRGDLTGEKKNKNRSKNNEQAQQSPSTEVFQLFVSTRFKTRGGGETHEPQDFIFYRFKTSDENNNNGNTKKKYPEFQ